jgi:hypothetical protein
LSHAPQAEDEEGPAPPLTLDADPAQTQCAISHEPFDSTYDQDRETWVYRGVVRLTGHEAERYGVPDGSIVKVECLAEADLGSSPAALAAAAAGAAAAAVGAEDEVELAAAAAAAGQQEQQQAAATAGGGAAAAVEESKPQVLVKAEPAEFEVGSGAGDAMKLDPDAAAVGIKQQPNGTDSLQQQATAAAAAAAGGVKRDSSDVEQQQDGTPSKKQRVSP